MVHFKNSKIDDFGDFRLDLGQKSTIFASAERQVDPAKSKNFQTFPRAKIFLWVPFCRIFSALQSGGTQFPALQNLKINPPKSPIPFARFGEKIATQGGPLKQL